MLQSIERSLQRGPKASVTGPVVRGDRDVVLDQLRLVREKAPELFPVVRSLAEATALFFSDRWDEMWREVFQGDGEQDNQSDNDSP